MSSTSSRKSKRSDYTAASITSRRRHHRTSTRGGSKYTDSDNASKQKHSFTNTRFLNGAICILAFCLISTANFQSFVNRNDNYLRRRFLLGPPKLSEDQISKSRSHHLFPVDYMPNGRAHTVAYFDHDDASPYKDMLSLYQCLAEDIAVHSLYGVDHMSRFQLYENERKATLDMPTFRQAMSEHDGLLILTDEPYVTVNQLFDRQHRGRMFALFTNPVYRAVQQFMSQKDAKSTSLLNWITTADDNVYIKKILGKQANEPVTLVDLQMAKEFVRQSVVVGLSSEMKESFNRFNVALGVGESEMRGNAKCLEEIFKNNDVEIDKFAKMVRPNSREWNAIAQRNYLDMALYTYMEKLFEEYDGVFNFFPQDEEDDLDAAEEVVIEQPDEEEPQAAQADSTEELPAIQESSEEREARIMKNSPYAGADEEAPVEAEESPVAQNDSTDPKAALKRRLADVSSFEFGSDKAATPFFWHVPKAGGTAIQNLYWCMGLTLANEVGGNPKLLQRKSVPSDKLTVFQPWKNSGNMAKVVNVDVTTHKGIANAIQLGFLTQESQPKTDFVSSSLFHVVSMKLFSKENKARMFALFRHPVERAVSKFYYLSKASWEPTYDETWANMTLEEWATNDRGENNWLVHHLAGKKHFETVDRNDLEMAKEMIKSKFIVGMVNEFDESVHRFNLLLGVDEKDSTNKQCMADFSQTDDSKSQKKELSNRNSYTKAQEGSTAWSMIAEINSLDVELFSFIEEQFEAQKHLFEQYEAQRIIFDQLQAQQNVKTG